MHEATYATTRKWGFRLLAVTVGCALLLGHLNVATVADLAIGIVLAALLGASFCYACVLFYRIVKDELAKEDAINAQQVIDEAKRRDELFWKKHTESMNETIVRQDWERKNNDLLAKVYDQDAAIAHLTTKLDRTMHENTTLKLQLEQYEKDAAFKQEYNRALEEELEAYRNAPPAADKSTSIVQELEQRSKHPGGRPKKKPDPITIQE